MTATDIEPSDSHVSMVYWLTLAWYDERLDWDPVTYDGLIRVPTDELWTPSYYYARRELVLISRRDAWAVAGLLPGWLGVLC
ncbi:hypothetical protein OAO87_04675 [bacterium]|nr:hypothetical protein [bacterium]